MRVKRSVYCVVCAIVLLAAACGSDSGDGTDSGAAAEEVEPTTADAAEPSTTADATSTSAIESSTTADATATSAIESSTTEAGSQSSTVTSETGIPGTPVAAFLNQAYLFGSTQGPAEADQLPFPVDSVTAHWYQSDGFYVVVYGALAPEQALCPGNSIQTSTGFEFVSNAPLGGADCSFAPTLAESPNGVVTCNRVVSYVTLIPAGTEGTLFGTIETMSDGLGVGLTSQVRADPTNMPTIDRSLIDC